MSKQFQSKHKLQFEIAPYPFNIDPNNEWKLFKVGTCEGLWSSTENSYDILAVDNKQPNNGHFTDVLQWFENSCKRDKKNLRMLEVWNQELKIHLVKKRGFVDTGDGHVMKIFEKKATK